MSKDKDLLASVSDTSTESEFFSPVPAGYKKGKTRYVFVMGTVMSGLGKGIFSSCLAKLMQDKGLKVAPIKLEGYLNIDSGTLNPFRHGEVFVLDDGMETDMDLGTYERMLDQDLSRANFATSGQIFSSILHKERHGDYLGRDVQMIPHVTGEVKLKLRQLAAESNADIVFVEIGGTVGDLENAYYIEAMRELAYEEGPNSCCFVALTYILEPKTLGEQKSKAAQLGIKQLMQLGIQPDIIACRAANVATEKVRQKISIYSNVPLERVISLPDSASIYMIPAMLREASLDFEVLRDVLPGEIILINEHGFNTLKQLPSPRRAHCAFEWAYTASIDSCIDGLCVLEARHNLGSQLAQRDEAEGGLAADLVAPVPMSGIGHAIGYHMSSRLNYQEVFLYNRYADRSYTQATQVAREQMAKRKLSVLHHAVKNRRIVLCDDSIVRGTQILYKVHDLK